jgi:Tfp pilus assembly protein PilX
MEQIQAALLQQQQAAQQREVTLAHRAAQAAQAQQENYLSEDKDDLSFSQCLWRRRRIDCDKTR